MPRWSWTAPGIRPSARTVERARKVRRFLVNQGVQEDLLSVKGLGDGQPRVPNTSVANKAKNRRVEIVLTSAR